jgi:sulfur-carrier protein adenylyltransferase/sulfurtransferase
LIDYERFCGVEPETTGKGAMETETELSVAGLKEELDRGEPITLVDVREPYEWDIGNLGPQGARLIPLGDLPDRYEEIDPESNIVIHCRSGARSARAADFLREHGYARVRNLEGGILAWSEEIDPSIPKY